MKLICKRCNNELNDKSKTESICTSCNEDLELLDKQLEVNNRRIKKLEEHKRTTEIELKSLDTSNKHQVLLETMKRINHNLQIEYEQHEGIIKAIKTKEVL